MQSAPLRPLFAPEIAELAQRDRLAVASRMADAILVAHERGVVCGNLCPAMLAIGADQSITVTDRVADGMAGTSPPPHANDAWRGRAAYEAPEQLRGRPFDRRADIWAFGCIVYELLSGTAAFGGDTLDAARAAVLERNPDWSRLPNETPTRIVNLLRHCLQKDPRDRLHHLADARIEIDATLRADTDLMERGWLPPAASGSRLRWILASALVLANVILLMGWMRATAPAADGRAAGSNGLRAVIPVSGGTYVIGRGSSLAISPDGSQLVYVAEAQGRTRLYRRPLDEPEAHPIDGTDGAADPFFSPDGKWIGFFAGENVMKVPAGGGAAVTVADAPTQRGLAWGLGDTIVAIPRDNTGVWHVSAHGGTLEPLTTLSEGDASHRWPQVLPGGTALIYTIWDGVWDTGRVAVQPLVGGRPDPSRPRRVVIDGGGFARFIPGVNGRHGRLVYAHADTLLSVAFDPSRLEVSGEPAPVAEGLITNFSGGAQFAVSPAGTVAYVATLPAAEESELLWVTRGGAMSTAMKLRGLGRWYDLSPDGRRLLRYKVDGPAREVWVDDLATGASAPLLRQPGVATAGPEDRLNAVWSPDGRRAVYAAGQPLNLYTTDTGGGGEQRLTRSANVQWPGSLSPDGRMLAFVETDPQSGSDIWVLPLGPDGRPGTPRAVVSTPFNDSAPMISPDGQWLAYQSNESGRYEVYVQPFPGGGQRLQVSTDQGVYPRWSRRSGELFFRAGAERRSMVSVTIAAGSPPSAPRQLFQERGLESIFMVSPDAQRFLMVRSSANQSPPSQIHILANWYPPRSGGGGQ